MYEFNVQQWHQDKYTLTYQFRTISISLFFAFDHLKTTDEKTKTLKNK